MASSRSPPFAANSSFTVPSRSTLAGQLYPADVPARTVADFVSAPLTATPAALSVTATSLSTAVAFRTKTRSSAASPTRRKRGSAERRRSGFVETSSFVPSPTCVSPLMARACVRHVVRSSGIVTST